jgi:hypothetical protein
MHAWKISNPECPTVLNLVKSLILLQVPGISCLFTCDAQTTIYHQFKGKVTKYENYSYQKWKQRTQQRTVSITLYYFFLLSKYPFLFILIFTVLNNTRDGWKLRIHG